MTHVSCVSNYQVRYYWFIVAIVNITKLRRERGRVREVQSKKYVQHLLLVYYKLCLFGSLLFCETLLTWIKGSAIMHHGSGQGLLVIKLIRISEIKNHSESSEGFEGFFINQFGGYLL